MANDCIPYFEEDGDRLTCTPTAAVSGKRFVAISGNIQADGTFSVAPPAAGGRVFGVAAWDSPIGGKVTVLRTSNMILPVTLGAAGLAAGAEVQVDATGAVVALAAGRAVGFLLTAGGAIGDDAFLALY